MAALAQSIAFSTASMAALSHSAQTAAGKAAPSQDLAKSSFFGTRQGLKSPAPAGSSSEQASCTVMAVSRPGWGCQTFPSQGAQQRLWQQQQVERLRRMQQAQGARRTAARFMPGSWGGQAGSCVPGGVMMGPWGMPLGRMQTGSMQQLMEEVFRGMVLPGLGWDVKEEADRWQLRIELPGFGPEDVQVQVEDTKVLSIRAQRQQEAEASSEEQRRSRRRGAFQTRLPLPNTINAEAISADISKGVLVISLPKKQPAEEKQPNVVRVEVQEGSSETASPSSTPAQEAQPEEAHREDKDGPSATEGTPEDTQGGINL